MHVTSAVEFTVWNWKIKKTTGTNTVPDAFCIELHDIDKDLQE